ncbi:hypothetical protein DFH08DRAFT_1001873 [Mycena albidolilacea]|uniref:ZZ-type domain-containing protein n=1 Tax=Mycena albidolilacea TaxID=1033008 RepID=A0AAD7A1J5_9AGAR|nr:hypothetical protein DFH08DRAFT_1001873 [Mycena albidolilacea]
MPIISAFKLPQPHQAAQVAQPTTTTTAPAGTQFFCDECTTMIPGISARVHCLTCPDYDICADCALTERFGGNHTTAHPAEVYRISGDSTLEPVRSQTVVTYASPPSISRGGTSVGEAPAGVGPSDGWGLFFDVDLNPSPAYSALMAAIFGNLDSARTGFLAPEAYSRFMDDMCYPLAENIWKANASTPANADAVLRRVYEALGLEHITQTRPGPPNRHHPMFQALLGGTATPSSMPLLTLRGLADLMLIELLSDPSLAYPRLVRAVQLYGLHHAEPYRRWGAMPRSVLPATADPRVLARTAAAEAQVRGAVANAAMGAQIQAAANLAAVNAVGGTQYRYERY